MSSRLIVCHAADPTTRKKQLSMGILCGSRTTLTKGVLGTQRVSLVALRDRGQELERLHERTL